MPRLSLTEVFNQDMGRFKDKEVQGPVSSTELICFGGAANIKLSKPKFGKASGEFSQQPEK